MLSTNSINHSVKVKFKHVFQTSTVSWISCFRIIYFKEIHRSAPYRPSLWHFTATGMAGCRWQKRPVPRHVEFYELQGHKLNVNGQHDAVYAGMNAAIR